jgi:phosphoglycerate dehydrogenase-like enzyme
VSLTVLEYIRHPDGVWNLPRPMLERLEQEFPAVRFVSPQTRGEVDKVLPEAEIVLGWAVRPDNFERAQRLKWIQVTAAGVAPLLFPALVESPVLLTNGRGLHAAAMAEHTLGVMLAFVRNLHLARDAQLEKRWIQNELWGGPGFRELEGTTMGLIGFGAVGSAVAAKAAALGIEVIVVRRHPAADPAPASAQWRIDRLPELLARADWVVLAAPVTPETKGLIGREALGHMKKDAILINLGRGALVDEPALVDTLRAGRIAGAALDVFEEEPLPAASPLWGMPEVIVTPHVSGLGPRYWERSVDLFARNLRAFQRGEPLVNIVDKKAGY